VRVRPSPNACLAVVVWAAPSQCKARGVWYAAPMTDARASAENGRPALHGRQVTLRPAVLDDAPGLLAILDEPEVAQWWRRGEWERLNETDAATFAIVLDGVVAGCIQYHEETDPDYFSAAVDIFVSAAVVAWLIDVRDHHRLTVDPAVANTRAIHVYETLGFRPVGTLREYERVADGSRRDALLMELLAAEFVRG